MPPRRPARGVIMTADGHDPAFGRTLAAMIFAEREFVFVGGPNGSGKTTAAHRVVREGDGLHVGADAIAAGMDPEDPFRVRIAASKRFGTKIREELPGGRRLVVGTTLSGLMFTRTVAAARAAGRPFVIVFTYLHLSEQCIASNRRARPFRRTPRIGRGCSASLRPKPAQRYGAICAGIRSLGGH